MSVKREYDMSSKNLAYKNKEKKTHHSSVRLDNLGRDPIDKPSSAYKRTEIIRDGKKFPVFQKPKVSGVFSVDLNRRFLPDASQLKYLFWSKSSDKSSSKSVNFNLNEGIKECVRKDEFLNEKLDHIFQWMKYEGNQREECATADFICFRGLLTLIMGTPYEQQDGWIICASQRNNTIFLCAFDTQEQKRDKEKATDRLKSFQSWGFKFEQFMLAEEPGQKPDTSRPVLETEEMACVFRTKLNNHSIVYVAEMDGVQSDEPVDADTLKAASVPFVELKTSRRIETQRQDKNFKRYKLLKWWCQSFLVGIETIYCGFRDDDGIVNTVTEYRVRDLPKMAKGLWDPCVCMNFCAQFLDFVKACVRECADPNALWKFEWTPGSSIMGREIDRNSEFSFIPEWYTSV